MNKDNTYNNLIVKDIFVSQNKIVTPLLQVDDLDSGTITANIIDSDTITASNIDTDTITTDIINYTTLNPSITSAESKLEFPDDEILDVLTVGDVVGVNGDGFIQKGYAPNGQFVPLFSNTNASIFSTEMDFLSSSIGIVCSRNTANLVSVRAVRVNSNNTLTVRS